MLPIMLTLLRRSASESKSQANRFVAPFCWAWADRVGAWLEAICRQGQSVAVGGPKLGVIQPVGLVVFYRVSHVSAEMERAT
ncbi:hypothetical protein EMIT0P12_70211 [Pseudomonas sp. IT-P12]